MRPEGALGRVKVKLEDGRRYVGVLTKVDAVHAGSDPNYPGPMAMTLTIQVDGELPAKAEKGKKG